VIATAFRHWKAMQNASYAEQPSQSAERWSFAVIEKIKRLSGIRPPQVARTINVGVGYGWSPLIAFASAGRSVIAPEIFSL
jgi:hypothetical protein